RARALGSNFAGQWLYLRNLKSLRPDEDVFPDFDDNLRQALQRETELLFESVVLEDRGILDLLNADYTFVNERLARHYGIPSVYGDQYRRGAIPGGGRKGNFGGGRRLCPHSYPNPPSPPPPRQNALPKNLGAPPPPPPPHPAP